MHPFTYSFVKMFLRALIVTFRLPSQDSHGVTPSDRFEICKRRVAFPMGTDHLRISLHDPNQACLFISTAFLTICQHTRLGKYFSLFTWFFSKTNQSHEIILSAIETLGGTWMRLILCEKWFDMRLVNWICCRNVV